MRYARRILWAIVGFPVALVLVGFVLSIPFFLIAQGVSLITTGVPLVIPDLNAVVPEHVRRGLFNIWCGFGLVAGLVSLPEMIRTLDS